MRRVLPVIVRDNDALYTYCGEVCHLENNLYNASLFVVRQLQSGLPKAEADRFQNEKELTEDLIQIITVFANRLYGKRSKKAKKLIAEISGKGANPDDDGQKDPASADT